MPTKFPPPMRTATPPLPMQKGAVQFGKPRAAAGHRIVLYGPGGIGKTTLACHAPGPVAFFDLDDSLARLRPMLAAAGLEPLVIEVDSWQKIRDALQAPGWDGIKTIVIDSATKAEEMAIAHTLEHTLQDGKQFKSVEAYGYGKGLVYVFDTFLPLLADLDAHARAGRNVVLICHDCTTTVPNPAGEDWLRYEPRLQSPASGKASIRLRAREWADQVLFLGWDVDVSKDGKGKGCNTRTLYPREQPHCMAKSRTLAFPLPVDEPGPDLWEVVINGETEANT